MATVSASVEILLVEDNPRDAELTLRVLRRRYLATSIVHVSDGAEAMEWMFCTGRHASRLIQEHPKVVLLDLKLPKIDGLEVLRAIRADSRTQMMPVVILTSSGEERDIVESYESGANSYITKPVEFETFAAAVAEAGHYWVTLNQKPR